MSDERLIQGRSSPEDIALEATLRPSSLAEYVGQARVKENLGVFLEAARRRAEPLDHVLLYGPPGLGKTTLAHIVSREMGTAIRATSGPALEKAGDLAAILTNLQDGDVLFVDEIHRLPAVVEEALYPALEDFQLDVVIGQGPSARTVKLDLPQFTLVGATTRAGLLTSPLRARFGIVHHLDFYSDEELRTIVRRSARILEVPIEEEGEIEIARRSRGTPRVANRLLRRVRDFAQVRGDGIVTGPVARASLETLEVDSRGLDDCDRRLLLAIIEKFGGGPVGLSTLSAALGEEEDTLEETVEPYLLQIGFLERTPRGRKATAGAYTHLDRRPGQPPLPQKPLF